jgi:hypothetical protein
MAFRLKATGGEAPLPAGIYAAVLESIDEREGTNGPYLMWKFTIDHDGRTVMVSAPTSMNCGPKANARQYAEALLGRPMTIGEELAPEALYGAECQLVLTVVSLDTGGTVNRIQRVLSPAPGVADEDVPF